MPEPYLTIDYTPRDRHIVDYDLWSLPEAPRLQFRGPRPDLSRTDHVTCMGAAQALGVLIDRPYPALLAEALDRPVLNFGMGGVSASFLAEQDALIEHANRGAALVLQVVSARSEPNERFERTANIEMLRDTVEGDLVNTISEWMRAHEDPKFLDYVEQSRHSWAAAYERLLDAITVPVVLFWFSPTPLGGNFDPDAKWGIQAIGGFPQLVDQVRLDAVVDRCDQFVVCHSERDFAFEYIDKDTGEPTTIDWGLLSGKPSGMEERRNAYYPSPAMNEDALPGLLDALAAVGVHAG